MGKKDKPEIGQRLRPSIERRANDGTSKKKKKKERKKKNMDTDPAPAMAPAPAPVPRAGVLLLLLLPPCAGEAGGVAEPSRRPFNFCF
jgi:hypothetical protein